jgi:hypothetical protein
LASGRTYFYLLAQVYILHPLVHAHGTKVWRLFHQDEGVPEQRRLVVVFMLLVAWICLMWAQFYTESFAFVSVWGRCTDSRPRTPIPLLSILAFILRHVTVYVRAPDMPLVAVEAVSPWNVSSSVANALNIPVRDLLVLSQWNKSVTLAALGELKHPGLCYY